MSVRRSYGEGGRAESQSGRGPGGAWSQGDSRTEPADDAGLAMSGEQPGPAEPVRPADDPAAGTMPDIAWLAALFAEGEALFAERDARQRRSIPTAPEPCRAGTGRVEAADLSSGLLDGAPAPARPDARWGVSPDLLVTTGTSVRVPPGGPSSRPSNGMVSGDPVAPVAVLQVALAGAPGADLARVVAELTGPGATPGGLAVTGPTVVHGAEAAVAPEAHEVGAAALAGLSDDVLGELVGACARLQSWAAGVQAQAMAGRAARETHPLAHDSLVGQVTAELVITQAEGSDMVVRAESGAQHPSVITALVSGRIDVRKAHTLLRSAAQLTVAERAEAISRYLPQAPVRTWRWLRNKLLAFAKARHGAEESARAATLDRNVQVDRAENDMGWLSAYLPAVDAAAVWGVVDDMAHQLRYTAGEERTLGQLRADCLTGIVTGRLLPADRCAATAPEGTPGGAIRTIDTTSTSAGTRASTTTEASSGADGATVCTCGGRAPVVHETVVRVVPTRPVVRVTVPASTLLGLDDAPADLDGFGPVPGEVARLLAEDATWRRLVTDPVTGVLVDHSSQAYTPGKVLRAAVEARDGTCTFVGCDTPATTCDLDHIEPFDHAWRERAGATGKNRPGQTNARNLHALCRRHHLLKTHAGWGVERDPVTGTTTWTTPAGRTHTRPPTVLDTRVDLDQVDPGTSADLTMRALTGRRLPRAYTAAAPAAAATDPPGPEVPPY